MLDLIHDEMRKTRELITQLENDSYIQQTIIDITKRCVASLSSGGKILFCGNGGSAADSQHLAAELVSRLCYNRPALSALALTTDTSALTAIGNDYSFELLFARQVEALGQVGDILIGISTSGKSSNVMKAFEAARAKGMTTIGFCGKYTAMMAERCNVILSIPSSETPKIQESHIMLGHIICALIEEEIFGAQYNPARQSESVAVV